MDYHGRRGYTDRIRLGGSALPVVSPARLYVCGITPYDVTHLGHASTFVWADAAAAVLRLAGADTLTCRNVTDVDDALTRAAAAHGRHFDEFALEQDYLFGRDMAALRVRRPEYEPRARHHVGRVVQLALALLARGYAYQRDGAVYFRGADVPAKAELTLEDATELATEFGDRPDDLARDDPFDVPVWRPSADEAPGWPSPWGRGRPGWHAECARALRSGGRPRRVAHRPGPTGSRPRSASRTHARAAPPRSRSARARRRGASAPGAHRRGSEPIGGPPGRRAAGAGPE
jgi:L-cysteine:1D-myo-inositol 2-amino-2-deoxy-alpha-D-glucopyranoside ligase